MAFPTNPTDGQQTTVNGVIYTWNSAKGVWTVTSSGGSITTANAIATSGNVTASYFIGNGSQLTGLPASYGDSNVVSLLASFGSNSISTTGNITVGNLVESSSLTLKENIRPIENSLESLKQLAGVLYDRKNKTTVNEPGLIAEAVNEIIPELVYRDAQGNPQGIYYTKLGVYLLEAIKTLSDDIDKLKKRG